MSTQVMAVRGAINLDYHDLANEGSTMVEAVGRLMDELCRANQITVDDIISLQFTQTVDLRRKNAAAALREARPVFSTVPLFCSSEPDIEGALPKTIRVLVTWRGQGEPRPVYLGEAARLRPDLIQ